MPKQDNKLNSVNWWIQTAGNARGLIQPAKWPKVHGIHWLRSVPSPWSSFCFGRSFLKLWNHDSCMQMNWGFKSIPLTEIVCLWFIVSNLPFSFHLHLLLWFFLMFILESCWRDHFYWLWIFVVYAQIVFSGWDHLSRTYRVNSSFFFHL